MEMGLGAVVRTKSPEHGRWFAFQFATLENFPDCPALHVLAKRVVTYTGLLTSEFAPTVTEYVVFGARLSNVTLLALVTFLSICSPDAVVRVIVKGVFNTKESHDTAT